MPPTDDVTAAPFSGADMIARLESGRRVIEQKFLDTGQVLSDAIDGIAALMAALENLTMVIGPAAIAETSRQLADAAAQLMALPAKQTARRRLIEILAGQQEGLASGIVAMRRNLAYMRAFSFNVKITAAGIANTEAGFDVFAQEISERIEAGHGEMDEVERAMQGLTTEIARAMERADALEQGCATLIPAVPDRLLASAATMAEHRRQVAATVAEASAVAQDVRRKVSRVLAALQVGDSTRQRIEHVQHGIALLHADQPDLDGAAVPRLRAVVGALLKAQLAATLAEYSRETQQIGIGLNGMGKDAAALMRLRELATGKNRGDSNGILRVLEQRVGEAVELVNEIEQAAALAQVTGQQAARAVQALSERLDAILFIKSDVMYMALNTTLKSSRLGEPGLPLSIIAKELRGHAEELDMAAVACSAALKALTETAAALARQQDDGPSEPSEQSQQSEPSEQSEPSGMLSAGKALTAAIERIRGAGDETERDVAALAGHGERVLALLTKSAHQLGLQDDIGGALQDVVLDLDELGAPAVACGADIRLQVAKLFDAIGATYTMAQEREIAAAAAAAYDVPATEPKPREPAEAEDALF